MDSMVLTLLGLLPLVGGAVVFALPDMAARATRIASLVFGLGTLAAVIGVGIAFDTGDAASFQFAEQRTWIPQLGASWAFGLDGIGLAMISLTAIVTPVCMLAAFREFTDRPDKMQFFLALMLVLEAMVLWVFMARDLFLFYVLFEAMLVPMYFMIGITGGPAARAAGVKFLLYNLAGGLIMLVGVIGSYVYGPGGEQGFLIDNLTGIGFESQTVERLLFLAVFFAFAVKAPMWPLHAWLPDAAEASTPSTAVMISAVMDKVGTFGMLVICLPLFPNASQWAAPAIVGLAVVSVLLPGLIAIVQPDLKRLIAYTSVSHFGFIVMGIFALTSTGHSGSVFYMVSHAFSTAALFLVAGMFIARYKTSRIDDFGGMQRTLPWLTGSFLLAGLSALAMPGMSSFVGEILVLVGTFQRYRVAGIVAVLGIVLSALYILYTYQRMATGPVRSQLSGRADLLARERWIVVPLMSLILALGFFPKPLFDVVTPAAERTVTQSGAEDPEPVLEVLEGHH
ncbi:MAG: NADH-quinone oxidoreductase subunit M [Micrococcales bacterium]|nr:MAG: NADH-quinone oxidoreductase subunit M [Micrococcales bacterium]PIE25812.1 MAG: NADH-quinone oxidoreductase subunit M [Micrococcales bacterium]